MGHLFEAAGLTAPNSALTMPSGQQFVGAPQQVLKSANSALPSISEMSGDDVLNPQSNPDATANLPKISTPSFQQAVATGPAGTPNALSPALTKGGKLATLLMGGLQGALAGRAASEQAVIQSGGRRSAGAGTGFQAGYQLPFTRAMMPLELQKQQAETGLAQAGLQPVETPYGNMPAALASKILAPYLGYQGKMGAAQIGGQSRVQSADIGAQGRVQAAQINKRYLTVPGVGLFDTQQADQNGRPSLVPGSAQGITVTPEIAADYGLPDQFVGKPMKLSDLSSVERAQNQGITTVQGAGGPASFNKRTGATRNLGLGVPALGGAQEVADPGNPGETKFMTKGSAISSGAAGPNSASVQVPRAAAKAEVPTKIGDQKVAFTTAIQHADLLRQAVKALGNGDVQALNGLENRFANQFGSTGPITAQVIADAYGREVTSMLSKGHMTDSEIATVGSTVDPLKQNYKQIDGVLNGYQKLAQSKMNMLNQQKSAAVSASQPKSGKKAPKANDPMGLR